jgi:LPS O-antigen subunit length determinant protein (WzzB/FepE family)
MQFRDPKTAADIVTYTLLELTDHMSNEARRVADINKKYLESQIDKTADPFIKTKIYSLIAQQIETAMMAEVKENFAFKILDPPRTPDVKIKPKRTQMTIIAFVVSLFLGIFIAFGREYWKNHREELKSLTDESGKR